MTYSRPWMFFGLAFLVAGGILLFKEGWQPDSLATPPRESPSTRQDSAPALAEKPATTTRNTDPFAWKDLFDGKTLAGWKAPAFGGEGKVYVKDGAIVMEMGGSMTGVTWTGEVIRNNYELSLEGMRLDGSDFFCTTTFPVGGDPCSLVVGGWGGMVVGLSNVDFEDASNNTTSKTVAFKENRWYRVRIRVSDAAIEAWIDDDSVVFQPRAGHKFGIRYEVDLCQPLGICTWSTKGAARNIRLRALKPEEIETARQKAKALDD